MRHFLEVDDLSAEELAGVLDRAEAADHGTPLSGKGVALLFATPSLRTRHSCEMAVVQLGGHPISVRPDEIGVNDRETPADIWTSMGFEAEAEARTRAFEGWIVDDSVLASAAEGAVFMHCLPAHRGEEVAASVIDGPRSVVLPQAHNRLHSFRAIAWWLAEVNGR